MSDDSVAKRMADLIARDPLLATAVARLKKIERVVKDDCECSALPYEKITEDVFKFRVRQVTALYLGELYLRICGEEATASTDTLWDEPAG